ncbi:ATP-dependent helicase HrpB [Tundrisphaera sp. TA3]|uniref:ATP-dependent helicase HrpB n=1 Tax=Tundrisphaera sp. TA3 TaxID=3435775 RepID=UPI003EBB5F7F
MNPLPIDASIPEILEAARVARSLVLIAPPGAGKTTRVPPALLGSGLLDPAHPRLVLLQPRRVAARAAAARIADENGWRLGEEVGYHIRFERKIGPRTRLRVLTKGLLNRQLVADPFLEGVGAVVLDEFHERSHDSDLAIALLREIRETVREDLILVVMSATMEAGPVARFLGDCPIVRAQGRSYPVSISYRGSADATTPLHDRVASAVRDVLDSGEATGDILAFLPGVEEIRRAGSALEGWARQVDASVLPLHGSLSADEQDRALRPAAQRKVILATNIAETSLTIDGVATVIDGGRARYASYDPERGLDRLELGRISRASADQRAGRAGRTRPGRCVRLWSEGEHRGLLDADVPEIGRVDLCGTVLALHAWGQANPSRFGWFEAPPALSLEAAESLLTMLGALDPVRKEITPIGRRLLEIPAHPRIGRLLLGAAEMGLAEEGAALAALLSEKDILAGGPGRAVRPSVHAASDILIRLDRLGEAERARFAPHLRDSGIDPNSARQAAKVRDDLLRIARRLPGSEGRRDPDEADLLRLVLLAYPDRVVRRRGGDGSTGVMVGGRGVKLDPASVVREAEFFLAIDPREDRRGGTLEARVRIASAIELPWLNELFPGSVGRDRAVRFDEGRRRAVGVASLVYRGLTVRDDANAPVDAEAAAACLADYLQPQGRSWFEADPSCGPWLLRFDLARRLMPEVGWPEFSEEDWSDLIASACRGCKGLDEIRSGMVLAALKSKLNYALNRTLDEQVPEALAVPSGNRIRLEYRPDGPPILAVRLQEMFGLAETPRIAGGRMPVVLHLLGPNYRPVQITEDLRNFWMETYFQVRKDLRSRYPKHSWPDDPLAARAEAKGSRRTSG